MGFGSLCILKHETSLHISARNSLWKQQSYRSGPLFESPKPRNFIHLIHLIHFQSTHIEIKINKATSTTCEAWRLHRTQGTVKRISAFVALAAFCCVLPFTLVRATKKGIQSAPGEKPYRDPMSSPKLRMVEFMEPKGTYPPGD